MEGWMRHNFVEILSHWKLEKMKTYHKKRQTAVYIVCYDNGIQHPNGLSQVPIWWKHQRLHSTLDFLIPLARKNI